MSKVMVAGEDLRAVVDMLDALWEEEGAHPGMFVCAEGLHLGFDNDPSLGVHIRRDADWWTVTFSNASDE